MTPAPTLRESIAFARSCFLPRVAGLALGWLSVASVYYEFGAPLAVWIAMSLHAFVWPHVAWWLARRSHEPMLAESRNLIVDHLLGGVWIAAMGFNALPSVLMLSMMAMDSMIAGGWRLMLRGVVSHALGAILGMLMLGWLWTPASGPLQQWASLPLLLLHPVFVGHMTHRALMKVRQQRAEFASLSERDPLSGLYNRRYSDARMREELARARRGGAPAVLVMVDIDHFKRINDRHGHDAGDEVIRALAGVLRSELRESDVAARYGGEEFLLLLPGARQRDAVEAMRRVRLRLRTLALEGGLRVTASFGVCELRVDIADADAWLREADALLYSAKRAGRDRIAHNTADAAGVQLASVD